MMTFRKTVLLSLAVIVSTISLVKTVNRLMPMSDGMVGHDYSYFFPYLLSGVQWIAQNGWLTIPYFTPDYCGGIPWLANPQSTFYSVPQFLTLLTNPVTAVNWTAIIFATIGAAASYGLLRKCFGVSWQAAGLVFVLFQLNSFLIFRTAVGHLTYHIFGLIPVLCWLALLPTSDSGSVQIKAVRSVGAMVAGGIMLAMMVYAGATNFIIPAALSVAAVLMVHHARKGWRLGPWCILGGACLWAIPLSAIKLFPAFIFVLGYPRSHLPHFYYLPYLLFADPIRLLKVLARSLFAPEILPWHINGLGLHEFEFGVSIVPLLIISAAILLLAKKPSRPRHLFAWIGLALVVTFPIALTMGNEAWGRILLKIPIINNNTHFVRWWSIYMMPLIVAAGLSFDRVFCCTRVRDFALCASVLVVVAQMMSRDVSYYGNDVLSYDPIHVIRAIDGISVGIPLPEISQVGPPPINQPKPAINDGFIWGISAYPCYEPLFHYDLELFPARQLQAGPVKSESDRHFNLVDPRCYLSLHVGTCPAGSLFGGDGRSDVAKFVSHLPLPWQLPLWQRFAEAATIIAGVLSALTLLALLIASVVRRQPRTPITL
jgi:hypothetical protein